MANLKNLFTRQLSQAQIQAYITQRYDQMDPQYRTMIFYGGVTGALDILPEVCLRTFGRITEKYLAACIPIYIQVWVRSHGSLSPSFSTPSYIHHALQKRFPDFPAKEREQCIDTCLRIIYAREPGLGEKIMQNAYIEQFCLAAIEENSAIEHRHLDDPEYGLVCDKPIFTNGIESAKAYLNSLQTADGQCIEHTRTGSCDVDGIAGMVDLYTIQTADGQARPTLYLCPYGSQAPTRVPTGFIRVEQSA